MIQLETPERKRTYIYPGGERLQVEGVTMIRLGSGYHHYLECADGSKVIMAPGWLAIEIDTDEWTFDIG